MLIAVSASGPSLDADVDPRFGRCQHFIVVDPDTLDFEAVENTSQGATGGAGIASAQVVAGKGVKAVLTGNCGPNAYQTLAAAGIEVIVGVSGTVRNAIERYKSGSFEAASGPSVQGHHGMSRSSGTLAGSGAGGGLGYGKGRVMGGTQRINNVPQQELDELKAQVSALGLQLANVVRSLDELEKTNEC